MTSSPKRTSRTSRGTTTYVVRSRSSSREETTNPTAPPALRSGVVSPRTGSGLPLAMWTMPRTPKDSAVQPITWRPAGPLCSGSRMTRHPESTRTSGTNQPTLPTVPETRVRESSISPPGTSNQTAAATTRARPTRNRPAPSRRCAGSSSRAPRPTPRAPAPTAWATASQVAATPRKSAWKTRATGPGPLRTARGAGRAAGRGRDAGARLLPVLLLVGFLVLRDRVLEPLLVWVEDREDPAADFDVDVLLLRDPGGEDVRVAMPPT